MGLAAIIPGPPPSHVPDRGEKRNDIYGRRRRGEGKTLKVYGSVLGRRRGAPFPYIPTQGARVRALCMNSRGNKLKKGRKAGVGVSREVNLWEDYPCAVCVCVTVDCESPLSLKRPLIKDGGGVSPALSFLLSFYSPRLR